MRAGRAVAAAPAPPRQPAGGRARGVSARPKHVLELAAELELRADQRAAAPSIHDEMHAAAVELGAEVLAAEERLDRRFAHRHIDDAALEQATSEIARLLGCERTCASPSC